MSKKLTELTVKEFVDVVKSDAPAPGGGSVSAVAAAMGVALGSMVASLTLSKKKYEEYKEIMEEIVRDCEPILVNVIDGVDTDTEAFNEVTDVFAMPKDTDEQKAVRKEAMQKALKSCTVVPYRLIENCEKALTIISQEIGRFNTTAASDLGVAALNLKSAAYGAWLNVLINVGGIKDEKFANEHRTHGKEMLENITKMADAIYEEVLKYM